MHEKDKILLISKIYTVPYSIIRISLHAICLHMSPNSDAHITLPARDESFLLLPLNPPVF